jgi:uncharacterized delta-60 repeat protein
MQYKKAWRIRRVLVALTLAFTLLSFIPARRAQAAAGDLDQTFGPGGKFITAFGGLSLATAVAVQADGRIVTAGYVYNLQTLQNDWALARYDVNGHLDASFGAGGKVITDFAGYDDQALAIALQPDGKIVTVGETFDPVTQSDFALARYNSDGSLDPGFGNGGKVKTAVSNSLDRLYGVALQSDGKIVVAGEAQTFFPMTFVVARYNANGSPDATFGTGGMAFTDFFGQSGQARGVVIQPDGRIVAGGSGGNSFALARYNGDGSLDPGFGIGGKATATFDNSVYNSAFGYDIALQPDGKVVVCGEASNTLGAAIFGVARFTAFGSLDPTFGVGGKTTGFLRAGRAYAVAIQRDGRIVVAGEAGAGRTIFSTDFAVARYNPDGSLDASFGNGGTVTTDFFGGGDSIFGIAIQPDGRIVAAGYESVPFVGSNFALARYDAGTSVFEHCLQDDSNGNRLQFNSTTGEYLFTNCNGLTLGGTGTIIRRGSTITLQHNSSDHRLLATLDLGTHRASASLQSFASGRTFTISDRNTTDNACACR